MNMISNGQLAPTSNVVSIHARSPRKTDRLQRDLGVEAVASHPSLPAGQKWAIRFEASDTVTIVLGIKDYGRGWYSSYFAALVAARLGISFAKIRVYYTGTLPAVLQQPAPLHEAPLPCGISPVAAVIADLIDGLCDQVIAKGQGVFAALAGIPLADIGFDESNGLFFLVNEPGGIDLIDLVKMIRSGAPVRNKIALIQNRSN